MSMDKIKTTGTGLVYTIRPQLCENFIQRYPAILPLILKFKKPTRKSMRSVYCQFLKEKDKHEANLGAKAETLSSPTFGTKTFYHFEWNGLSGWAELFEYYYQYKKQ